MEPEVNLDPSLLTSFKDELIYSVKRTRRRMPLNLQNKWLLYSSTLILLTFIFLSAGVTLVECAGAGQDSNDISGHGRHVDRIPQKFSISSQSGGDSGGSAGKSSHKNSNHDSNEVHSTFHFPSGAGQSSEGEDEGIGDEDDEGSYEDEDASYYDHDHFGESGELKPDDVQYLDSEEKGHGGGHHQKPQIAKCCPYGDAIAADGQCKKFRSLEAVHNQK